jgi:hypothetical protein
MFIRITKTISFLTQFSQILNNCDVADVTYLNKDLILLHTIAVLLTMMKSFFVDVYLYNLKCWKNKCLFSTMTFLLDV